MVSSPHFGFLRKKAGASGQVMAVSKALWLGTLSSARALMESVGENGSWFLDCDKPEQKNNIHDSMQK